VSSLKSPAESRNKNFTEMGVFDSFKETAAGAFFCVLSLRVIERGE
jgi:hypothetical protein